MWDFNAKVGKGREQPVIIGNFGLGSRNERGEQAVQFYQENHMVVTNRCNDQSKRCLYTWMSPADLQKKESGKPN